MAADDPPRNRRVLLSVAVLAIGLVAGYLGQGALPLGSVAPVAVTAVARQATGGNGDQQVRVALTVGLVNTGQADVQISGPDVAVPDGGPVTLVRLIPDIRTVPARRTADVTLDLRVRCSGSVPLAVPDLRMELPDGARRTLVVRGADELLRVDACARGRNDFLPLLVNDLHVSHDRLVVRLRATTRVAHPTAVRAGGVRLRTAAPLPEVTGTSVLLTLLPPLTCPRSWYLLGVPSTLDVDFDGTSVGLPAAPDLPRWLLSTSCRRSP